MSPVQECMKYVAVQECMKYVAIGLNTKFYILAKKVDQI